MAGPKFCTRARARAAVPVTVGGVRTVHTEAGRNQKRADGVQTAPSADGPNTVSYWWCTDSCYPDSCRYMSLTITERFQGPLVPVNEKFPSARDRPARYSQRYIALALTTDSFSEVYLENRIWL